MASGAGGRYKFHGTFFKELLAASRNFCVSDSRNFFQGFTEPRCRFTEPKPGFTEPFSLGFQNQFQQIQERNRWIHGTNFLGIPEQISTDSRTEPLDSRNHSRNRTAAIQFKAKFLRSAPARRANWRLKCLSFDRGWGLPSVRSRVPASIK